MSISDKGYFLAVIVGCLMALGQLLFKMGSQDINYTNTSSLVHSLLTSVTTISAILLYAITIILWIFVLKILPLSFAYPITALAFVITPVLAFFLFKEPYDMRTFGGSLLIVAGIMLINSRRMI